MSQRFAKDTVFLVGLSGSCYGIIIGIVGCNANRVEPAGSSPPLPPTCTGEER